MESNLIENQLLAMSDLQQELAALEVIKYQHVWENCSTYNEKHHDRDLWERRKGDYDFEASVAVRPDTADFATAQQPSVIVLGCGDGSLVRLLVIQGFYAKGVDLFAHPLWGAVVKGKVHHSQKFVEQGLWDRMPVPRYGQRWDLAISADVLEHIPYELLPIVLRNISQSCKQALFQIANMNSSFGGYDLHPIKEDASWWCDEIHKYMGGDCCAAYDGGVPAGRFTIKWMEKK